MPPDPIAESVRLGEADIALFEARMREVIPAYQQGDRVELHGEVFEVSGYQREEMPGYWLRGETEKLFWRARCHPLPSRGGSTRRDALSPGFRLISRPPA
jgi:hypothetical protein